MPAQWAKSALVLAGSVHFNTVLARFSISTWARSASVAGPVQAKLKYRQEPEKAQVRDVFRLKDVVHCCEADDCDSSPLG